MIFSFEFSLLRYHFDFLFASSIIFIFSLRFRYISFSFISLLIDIADISSIFFQAASDISASSVSQLRHASSFRQFSFFHFIL